jgi:hypothetical protein
MKSLYVTSQLLPVDFSKPYKNSGHSVLEIFKVVPGRRVKRRFCRSLLSVNRGSVDCRSSRGATSLEDATVLEKVSQTSESRSAQAIIIGHTLFLDFQIFFYRSI